MATKIVATSSESKQEKSQKHTCDEGLKRELVKDVRVISTTNTYTETLPRDIPLLCNSALLLMLTYVTNIMLWSPTK